MEARTTRAKSRAGRAKRDTAQQILDIAEQLAQVRGFNAFSYADVATELGITKASLHYHFQGKAELGQALITRYTQRFAQALAQIDSNPADASVKLAAYADLYADALRGQRISLCGMLAAEYRHSRNRSGTQSSRSSMTTKRGSSAYSSRAAPTTP